MEGGLVTLLLGAIFISLFTELSNNSQRTRAALHAICAASGAGLLTSGFLRASPLLMALGLGLCAIGLIYVLLSWRRAKTESE